MTQQQYGVSRYGWDEPTRIAGTTQMMLLGGEAPPGEMLYQPLVPFLPGAAAGLVPITDGSTGQLVPPYTTENGIDIWERVPARCDLVFWQGDDVIVPLYFRDPSDASLQMDEAHGYEWHAELRESHSFEADLIATLSCDPTVIAPVPPATSYTNQADIFYPRQNNAYSGLFHWEIYSVNTQDLSRFPKPAEVDDADWPPPNLLRTWLYGRVIILPRTSATDFLYAIDETLPLPPEGGYYLYHPFSGPNGRVP